MSKLKNLLEQYVFEARRVKMGDGDNAVQNAAFRKDAERILLRNKKWATACLVLLAAVLLFLAGFALWNLGNPQYLQTIFGIWGVCLGGLFLGLHKLWREKTVAELALLAVKYSGDDKQFIINMFEVLGAKI